MKKTKSILCLLLAAAMLLPGCKRTNTEGDTPHTDYTGGGVNRGEIVNPFGSGSGSASYDPNAEHGEKAVYGHAWEIKSYDRGYPFNAWGDYYFKLEATTFLCCYDRTRESLPIPDEACFDPLCNHMADTCPAFYQFDTYKRPDFDGEFNYPSYIFLDYYDNASSPVIYSVYRRGSVGHLGTEDFDQDPFYLIQRYDFSSGERVTLLSGIQDLIHSVCTYGDNLYYTISENYLGKRKLQPDEGSSFTLCMLPKAGGQPKFLRDENTKSLNILDITDDAVYYLVNSRYIYRCSPMLEDPELLLDLDSVTDENGNHVLLAALRDGNVFYFGNFSVVNPDFGDAGDCYRLSLEDPTADGVKIAEHMLCATSYVLFTQNYLYYMPAVMEDVPGLPDLYQYLNFSDGTVKAVNLFTGETVTCCENTGISFYAGYVLNGDCITVYGTAYEESGREWGTRFKHIRLYPDGRPAELWVDESGESQGYVIGG